MLIQKIQFLKLKNFSLVKINVRRWWRVNWIVNEINRYGSDSRRAVDNVKLSPLFDPLAEILKCGPVPELKFACDIAQRTSLALLFYFIFSRNCEAIWKKKAIFNLSCSYFWWSIHIRRRWNSLISSWVTPFWTINVSRSWLKFTGFVIGTGSGSGSIWPKSMQLTMKIAKMI